MEEKGFNYAQARAFAGQYGLIVGALWIASFGCAMYSFDYMLLGHVGNLCALLSLFVEVRLLKQFQREVTPLSGMRRWWMAWNISMYAALLTSFAQFLYFRFIDGGHLLASFNRMMEQPEYKELMESMMPGADFETILEEFTSMPIGALMMNFIAFNFFVALVFSVISTLFSAVRLPSPNESHQE